MAKRALVYELIRTNVRMFLAIGIPCRDASNGFGMTQDFSLHPYTLLGGYLATSMEVDYFAHTKGQVGSTIRSAFLIWVDSKG